MFCQCIRVILASKFVSTISTPQSTFFLPADCFHQIRLRIRKKRKLIPDWMACLKCGELRVSPQMYGPFRPHAWYSRKRSALLGSVGSWRTRSGRLPKAASYVNWTSWAVARATKRSSFSPMSGARGRTRPSSGTAKDIARSRIYARTPLWINNRQSVWNITTTCWNGCLVLRRLRSRLKCVFFLLWFGQLRGLSFSYWI